MTEHIAIFRYLFAAVLVLTICLCIIFGRQGDGNITILISILGSVAAGLFTQQIISESAAKGRADMVDQVKQLNGNGNGNGNGKSEH